MPDANSEIVAAVDQLRKSIDQLRTELVRKDVFDQVVANLTDRIRSVADTASDRNNDVKDDVEAITKRLDVAAQDRKADRRLLIAAFVGPFVMLLIGVYIAAQVGGTPT